MKEIKVSWLDECPNCGCGEAAWVDWFEIKPVMENTDA